MELSSTRFKALAVTIGFSFWFFVITTTIGMFSIELMGIFVIGMIIVTQIFAVKLSRGLDMFAILNTNIFLGILFVCVVSIYGIIFRVLRIDLLRLSKQDSYWLEMKQLAHNRIFKQY